MTSSKNLWGGRFTGQANETFERFNSSLVFDKRLFAADIRGSIAHANALAGCGVLGREECDAVVGALNGLAEEVAADPTMLDAADEDIHSFIESRIVAKIGDAGKKMHTGRSRNDQVATALRLYVRGEIETIDTALSRMQTSLLDIAERYSEAVMPGYTHLQRAQPVTWAHWCLAYFEMFDRDRSRFADAQRRMNVMPLGSGALAGTAFAIDRDAVAAELGFEKVSANSLDAVSDRDFAVDFASACSLVMVHLSRFAEDLILYASTEFGFIELGDAVSSGSSLMPQKKNPDSLELIRGKAARVFGDNLALLTMLKGLPLAYNKDMQEDKEAVFDAADTVKISLEVASVVLENTTVRVDKMRAAASVGYLNATELADHLVRSNMPFREAHETAGKIVLHALEAGKELNDLEPWGIFKNTLLRSMRVFLTHCRWKARLRRNRRRAERLPNVLPKLWPKLESVLAHPTRMDKFVRSLITEWRRLDLPMQGETVVVGVSGGADSVSLIDALHRLTQAGKLNNRLVAAHFNHGLRGADAERDAEFVTKLATALEIELVVGSGNVDGSKNVEQNARDARYAFLAETASNLNAFCVITAHTMNDQAETFLMNLIRGSGIRGLSGMRAIRQMDDGRPLIRPLLRWAKRDDTEDYCGRNEVEFRYDSMNDDLRFGRVRVRRVLLPMLEEFNPKIVETLSRTAELMADADANRNSKDAEMPSAPASEDLKRLTKAERYAFLREWLTDKRGNLRSLDLKHIEAIERLILSRKSGRVVELPGGETVERRDGELVFGKIKVDN